VSKIPREHLARRAQKEQRQWKSQSALGRWHAEHDEGPWVLNAKEGREKYRLIVERVALRRMFDGFMGVDVIAWLEEKKKGEWLRVDADPDGHYVFVGPPDALEEEIWQVALAVARDDHQDAIRAARDKGLPTASTTVFYDEKLGGGLYCYSNSSYSNSGDNLGVEQVWYYTDTGAVGQSKSTGSHWERYRAYLSFDTSGLQDDCIVTATTFVGTGYGKNDSTAGGFNVRVFVRDWGTSLTTADWCNEDTLPANHLCAFATGASGANWTAAPHSFTNNGTLLNEAINKTADTRLIVVSANDRGKSEPTVGVDEYVWLRAGTTCPDTDRAKLIVSYTVPGAGPGGGTGDEIDYSSRVCWSTYRSYTNTAAPLNRIYYCEESVSANDRAWTETQYTPVAGFYADFQYAGRGETYVPNASFVIKIPYYLAVGASLNVSAQVMVDGVDISGGGVTVDLPALGADSVYGLAMAVPTAKYATGSLSVRVTVNSTSGTAYIYWLPTSTSGSCVHWGLKSGDTSTDWRRSTPVVIMESPPASSHESPIPLAGAPIIRFTAEGVYPTDKVALVMYSDALHTLSHDPQNPKPQFTGVAISSVTTGIMPRGSQRRFVEIGAPNFTITPPAGATDVAPGVTAWLPNTPYNEGDLVIPTFHWMRFYRCSNSGTSAASEPIWPLTPNAQATPSTTTDNTVTWADAGDRYEWLSNTYYEMIISSYEGTLMVTSIPLHTVLSTKQLPNTLDASVPSPHLVPIDDTDSKTEVIVRVSAMESSPYYLEVELTDPDGTVHYYTPGAQLKLSLGRLAGA